MLIVRKKLTILHQITLNKSLICLFWWKNEQILVYNIQFFNYSAPYYNTKVEIQHPTSRVVGTLKYVPVPNYKKMDTDKIK